MVAHDRSTTRGDQGDGLQGDADNNAVRHESIEGMTSDTGDAPISDDDMSEAEEGSAAGAPTPIRPREIALTPAEWNAIPYDDNDETPRPVPEGLPPGARSIYDYLSVLEKVAPDLHAIETHLLMDRWTMRDVAASRGVVPSTVTRWRAEAHKVYRTWGTDVAGQWLPPNALTREVYLLWRQGVSAASITTRLNVPHREVRRMIKTFEKNDSTWPAEGMPTQPQRPVPLQPQDGSAAVIDATVRAHDAAVAEEDDERAEKGLKPRTRTREISLSPALSAALPGDNDGGEFFSRVYESVPVGAETPYDYVSYLEEIDPEMARIEQRILIDDETANMVAISLNCDPSTLSRRRRHVATLFTAWQQQSPFNRERAIDRQIYRLWQEGHEIDAIKKRVNMPISIVRRKLQNMISLYSRTMPRYQRESARKQSNPFAPQSRERQGTTHRPRGPYKTGENVRERILATIPKLASIKGEPPTKRDIQDALHARSNIDYHLSQLKADGRIRLAKGGQGYEVIPQNVGYRPNLERKM